MTGLPGGKEHHSFMRRISSVLTLTGSIAAGFAVFAALPAAPASAAIGNSANSAPAATATAGPSTTATVNVNAPNSTYAKVTFRSMRGGVQIAKLSITGVMTGKGCYQGDLYRNGKLSRQSRKVCAAKGQHVTVTWSALGNASIGTGFRTSFSGIGAPAGLEAFKIS
jgi:hypothetical protein